MEFDFERFLATPSYVIIETAPFFLINFRFILTH
jgi:hypothetical protein